MKYNPTVAGRRGLNYKINPLTVVKWVNEIEMKIKLIKNK